MVPPRTNDELKAAVDSMFRIRAVESPPDEHGQRSVWHRGTRGADLLSRVNAAGSLVHQEFVLFGDMLVWDQAGGVRTGEAQSLVLGSGIKPSDTVQWDAAIASSAGRLQRMSVALRDYGGDDRYLIFLRKVVLSGGGEPSAWGPEDAEEITRTEGAVSRDHLMTPPASPAQPLPVETPRSNAGTILLVVGALLVATALVLLLLK